MSLAVLANVRMAQVHLFTPAPVIFGDGIGINPEGWHYIAFSPGDRGACSENATLTATRGRKIGEIRSDFVPSVEVGLVRI